MAQVSPRTVGWVLGAALGAAGAATLFVYVGGYVLLIPPLGLAPVAAGLAAGRLLARLGAVPAMGPGALAALALLVAAGPMLAGMVEMRLRPAPFALPPGIEAVGGARHAWGETARHAWGETVVLVACEGAGVGDAPECFARLAAAAEAGGWLCETCGAPEMTGGGIGWFRRLDAPPGGGGERMGIEAWDAGKGFYGAPPRDVPQARIFHQRSTAAPLWTLGALGALAAGALGRALRRRRG
ncbi:hypothetical protein ACQ5SO_18095 [Rhodovulum sp. DZ06]|uniref:hypothetical protein n=1 Tax=Rhodovulum sp. DZ06 TaxID=3425126 RepID=UPI003D32A8B6